MKKTTEQFIESAKKIHGEKYDYSKVEYNGSFEKVRISCPIHGDFLMTPNNHLNGQGCPKCKNKNVTTEEFIEKARKIHGEKYDYSKVEYKKATEKICIICPEHGEFLMTPNAHLNGQGCKYCTGLHFNKDIFIEKSVEIYGEKYDYSKINYINNHTKVCIVCPEHGEFWQTPIQHLRGHGCPKCRKGNHNFDENELLEKIKNVYGDIYTYDRLNFSRMADKITVTCRNHGDFQVYPGNFLKGCGCPECNKSSLETKLSSFLSKRNIQYEYQKKFFWLRNKKPMSIDFYLPEYNVGIECQGEQHLFEYRCFRNRTFEKQEELDRLKNTLCKENGVSLLYYGGNKIGTFSNNSGIYTADNYFTSLDLLLSKLKDIYIK